MPFFRFIAPVIAIASSAYAQCSTSGTLTITNTADAAKLASCQTYTGSIAIATGATSIALDGPEKITGNVITVPEGQLQSLTASNLRQITGQLSVSRLANLNTLSMPSLSEVQSFYMSAIGQNLLGVDLDLTRVSMLTLDNTFLQTLEGINLMEADTITITNNELLTDLTMQIKNVTGTFTIRGNPNGLNVGLSNLASSANLIVNNCNTLSLDSYARSTGIVAFTDNYFETLSLPNLTATQDGLSIISNGKLNNISFPQLTVLAGGLDVINNTALSGSISFPKLKAAQSCAFQGSFSGVSLPALQHIPGQATFVSTKNIQSTCNTISSKVGGQTNCKSDASASVTVSVSGSMATGTHNAATRYDTSEVALGLFSALAALFSAFA